MLVAHFLLSLFSIGFVLFIPYFVFKDHNHDMCEVCKNNDKVNTNIYVCLFHGKNPAEIL